MAKIQFISSKRVLIKVYSLVGLSVISDLFFFCNPSAAHYAPYTIARLSVFVVFFFLFNYFSRLCNLQLSSPLKKTHVLPTLT